MKKGIIFLFLSLFSVGAVFAERYDLYHNLILPQATSSRYSSINSALKQCFEQKGFKVFYNQSWDDVPKEDWYQTIVASWEVDPGYGYPTTVTVEIYDFSNRQIAKYVETGNSISIGADVSIAINKITRVIYDTPYNFKSSKIDESKFPPIKMSEDSVKSYLKNKRSSNFEGIYKTYGENWYKIAIIKKDDRYVAFILDAESSRWKLGDIKAYLEPVRKNLFSTTYLMGDKSTIEVLATFDDDILTIPINSQTSFQALKIYPTNETIESNIPSNTTNIVATGSGFFISSRIIATNYHVVEDANGLKIVMYNGNDVKSYDARVLATDKINDLALVSIVDKSFTEIKDIPYSLCLTTKEVGTSVFVMGYPMSNYLGGEVKVTDGIINSKTGYQGDVVTYQISAPIQPGNSGGALFDKNGVLVGITNAKVPVAENVGYAIKTMYLKNLIEAAPIYIDIPIGSNLSGKDLTELVKILSPYVVFIEVY